MNKQALLNLCRQISRGLCEDSVYLEYLSAKEALEGQAETAALLSKYQRLQLKAQGYFLQGESLPEEVEQQLSALGQLLQFDTLASRFLLAEYSLQKLLRELYEAMQTDLRLLQPDFMEEEA